MGLGRSSGPSQTTSSGIDPEFKPYLTRALREATEHTFDRPGGLGAGSIAGQEGVQEAIRTQEALAQDALRGEGIYNNEAAVQRQLQNLAGQQVAAGQGTLGSARADRARQAALADQALAFNQARQQTAGTGAAALGQLAGQSRALEQEALDAPHTNLQRYFGYLGNVGQQQTTNQSGGGK